MKETESNFYDHAKSWYEDHYQNILCSRNRYRTMAMAFAILLTLSIVAITTMLPLKSYYYRIIMMDGKTGNITVLKEVEYSKIPVTHAITESLISRYIQEREHYDYEDIKRSFNVVIALSDKAVAEKYIADTTVDTNPTSPIKTLNTEFYKTVSNMFIQELNDNTATARFSVQTFSKENHTEVKKENFQAIIKWEYRKPSESNEERYDNPVGFNVTYYQVSKNN